MSRFLLRRIGSGFVVCFVVATAVFWLVRLFGPDPARTLLGQYATDEMIARKQHELGIDRPIMEQYLEWLGNAVTGDLGVSWTTTRPVADAVFAALPVTLSIAIGALLLASALALVIGVTAAVRGGWVDVLLQTLVVVGFALPGFWLALVFASVFAVQLGWFPATGYVSPTESVTGWLSSVTLPIVAESIGITAALAQQLRNSIVEVSRQEFVRTLRSHGIPGRTILFRHVLRNASGPTLTVTSLQFIGALGGAVVVERVFGLRGIGSIMINASTKGDLPMLMGVVVLAVFTVIVVNTMIDVALGALYPRMRVA